MYSNKIYISYYYGMLAMHAGVEGSAILQLVMELGERLKYIRPPPILPWHRWFWQFY